MPKNGERIDAIREVITTKSLDPELEAVMLTSLMEAADRVDSTVGLQMAYLKQWAKRASNDLELRVPHLLPCSPEGKGRSVQLDAAQAIDTLEPDIVYMDPPYNQHKYLGNYHIWESLVLWDKPEVYGVACKRVDCRDRSSDFNSKPKSREAFEYVISNAKADHLVVSFSDEGYFTKADIEEMLSCRGEVLTFAAAYKRHVGSQIGIYNPHGEKVGVAGASKNVEYIFVASKSPIPMEILKTRI